MTTMSIIFAPIFPKGAFDEKYWYIGMIIFIIFLIICSIYWYWMRSTGFGRIDYDKVNLEFNVVDGSDKEDYDDNDDQKEESGGDKETKPQVEMADYHRDTDGDSNDVETLKKQLKEAQDQLNEAQQEIENLKSKLADKDKTNE